MKTALTALFLFLATVLLSLSFFTNAFRIVPVEDFRWFQADSQALAVIKIYEVADGAGISEGGFLRRNPAAARNPQGVQSRADFAGVPSERYKSQFGLQGAVCAAFESAFKLPPENAVRALEALFATLTALTLTWFLWTIHRDMGLAGAAAAFAVLLFSTHLTFFARNLYWTTFAMLLPFVAACCFYPRAFEKRKSLALVLCCVGGFVFLKSLCGYEYITNIVLAPSVPVLFHGIRRQETWKRMARHGFLICLAGAAGFLLAMAVHWLSLSLALGGPAAAFAAISERAASNTIDSKALAELGGRVSWSQMLIRYHLPAVLNFGIHTGVGRGDFFLLKLSYGGLTISGAALAALLLAFSRSHTLGGPDARLCRAAAVAMGWGFLCTISWFILARNHNHHYHMNNIVFFIPFVLVFCQALAVGVTLAAPVFRRSAPVG